MFPLGTNTVPTTLADWNDAVAAALTAWIAGGVRTAIVGQPPALASVDLNLSGGRLADRPSPDLTLVGRTEPGPTVARLQVAAEPLIVRGVPVWFDLRATGVTFSIGRNAAGGVVLALADAADGRLTVRLSSVDLDAALLVAAKAAAAAHGVDIRSVHAHLTAVTPRVVDVALEVSVKKFVTFPLRIGGRLSIDDTLTATASNLRVDGTGMAATVAAGILRSQLAKAEGQRVSLLKYSLGSVQLRDVTVDAADGVRVTADFGPGPR